MHKKKTRGLKLRNSVDTENTQTETNFETVRLCSETDYKYYLELLQI